MKVLLQLALVLCLAVSIFASEGRADPVEVQFSGQIDYVDDANGYLPGGFAVGSSFSGIYIVDSVPLGPGLPGPIPGSVNYPLDPSSSITAIVGGSTVSSSGAVVQITNGDGSPIEDVWTFAGLGNISGFNCAWNCVIVTVAFSDPTLTRLSGTSYFVNTSFEGWSVGNFVILDEGGGIVLAVGSITSLQIAPETDRVFNLDIGSANGTPSSSYGAAGPTGTWNTINGFANTPLLDGDGYPSGISATLTTLFTDGVPSPATDTFALLGDHALDCVGEVLGWEILVDGLSDGDYRVWIYAPTAASGAGGSTIETGTVEVNGVAVSSLPGDASGALIEGTSYARVDVVVSGGSIGILGTGTGATDCAGVAGIQIEGPLPPAVPALGTARRALLTALLAAGAGILYCRRHGRREANSATR
jgi:hypothetical protein